MGELTYLTIMSLDGYVADERGSFDWAEPDEEVHTLVNDLDRPVGTFLLGRRMYEVLRAWETLDLEGQPSYIAEFAAIWRGADKVVYSRTLETPSTARTRIERGFDAGVVRELTATADLDLSIGGPELAGLAFDAGLVHACHVFVAPVVVGGGTPAFARGLRIDLELVDQRRFDGGFAYLRYRPRR
jgi:dihydrofolate reductase